MADLFDNDQSVVARHISNVFKEGELEKESNMQILHITLSKYKPAQVYSRDVIISVGYRVKSKRGTQFCIWANKVLKQYLLQGYAINERIAAQKHDELRGRFRHPGCLFWRQAGNIWQLFSSLSARLTLGDTCCRFHTTPCRCRRHISANSDRCVPRDRGIAPSPLNN